MCAMNTHMWNHVETVTAVAVSIYSVVEVLLVIVVPVDPGAGGSWCQWILVPVDHGAAAWCVMVLVRS